MVQTGAIIKTFQVSGGDEFDEIGVALGVFDQKHEVGQVSLVGVFVKTEIAHWIQLIKQTKGLIGDETEFDSSFTRKAVKLFFNNLV